MFFLNPKNTANKRSAVDKSNLKKIGSLMVGQTTYRLWVGEGLGGYESPQQYCFRTLEGSVQTSRRQQKRKTKRQEGE